MCRVSFFSYFSLIWFLFYLFSRHRFAYFEPWVPFPVLRISCAHYIKCTHLVWCWAQMLQHSPCLVSCPAFSLKPSNICQHRQPTRTKLFMRAAVWWAEFGLVDYLGSSWGIVLELITTLIQLYLPVGRRLQYVLLEGFFTQWWCPWSTENTGTRQPSAPTRPCTCYNQVSRFHCENVMLRPYDKKTWTNFAKLACHFPGSHHLSLNFVWELLASVAMVKSWLQPIFTIDRHRAGQLEDHGWSHWTDLPN